MQNGLASIGFVMEGLVEKCTELASDKRNKPHTFSISAMQAKSCVRIALMHTGSP